MNETPGTETIVELFGLRALWNGGSWEPVGPGNDLHKMLNGTLPSGGYSPELPWPDQAAIADARKIFGDGLKVITLAPASDEEEGPIES